MWSRRALASALAFAYLVLVTAARKAPGGPPHCVSDHSYPALGSVRNRTELWKMIGEREKPEYAAELGVLEGGTSYELLVKWSSLKTHYAVDLWRQQSNYVDLANKGNDEQEARYQKVLERLKPFGDRANVLRMTTVEAAAHIPDNSLDFVFVDARHDYCAVMEDIQAYWPKLKVGGIMSGHDYIENDEAGFQDWGLCEDGTREDRAVKGAVDDFVQEHGLDLHVTYKAYPIDLPIWYFRKTCGFRLAHNHRHPS